MPFTPMLYGYTGLNRAVHATNIKNEQLSDMTVRNGQKYKQFV